MDILIFLSILPFLYVALTITAYSVHIYRANKKLAAGDIKLADEYESEFVLGNTGIQKASLILNLVMFVVLLLMPWLFFFVGFVALILPIAIAIVESYIVFSPRKVLLEQYGKKVQGQQSTALGIQKTVRWALLGTSVVALIVGPIALVGWSIGNIVELFGQF